MSTTTTPRKASEVNAAIDRGRGRTREELAGLHHQLAKAPLISGVQRTFVPKDDEGEQLPPEYQKVQIVADDLLDQAATMLAAAYDLQVTQDETNAVAKADVIIDGVLIIEALPVTALLALDKALVDLHTFVKKLPTLDPAEHWTYDPSMQVWKSDPVLTLRNKRIKRNHERSPATDKHPAQVDVFEEDVAVGTWTTVKLCGAVQVTRARDMLQRVERLIVAVREARARANQTLSVERADVGKAIFDYVLSRPSPVT